MKGSVLLCKPLLLKEAAQISWVEAEGFRGKDVRRDPVPGTSPLAPPIDTQCFLCVFVHRGTESIILGTLLSEYYKFVREGKDK